MFPHKVCFIGHSICNQLKEFCFKEMPNFNFEKSKTDCKFISKRGLKICGLFEDDITVKLNVIRPDTIVLLIGDNDLQRGTNAQDIVSDLLVLARHLMSCCESVNNIVFSKLLPRYPGGKHFFHSYNDIACSVNHLLLQEVKLLENMRLFQMDFYFPKDNFIKYTIIKHTCFKTDGVHLTNRGLARMSRKLRSVISAATNHKL